MKEADLRFSTACDCSSVHELFHSTQNLEKLGNAFSYRFWKRSPHDSVTNPPFVNRSSYEYELFDLTIGGLVGAVIPAREVVNEELEYAELLAVTPVDPWVPVSTIRLLCAIDVGILL